MIIWNPVRSPQKKKGFVRTPDTTKFFQALKGTAPEWIGSWSLVRHVRGDVEAVRAGPASLLVIDLLSDFAPRKDGRLIATGLFSGGQRRASTWVRTHLLSLDLDDGSAPEALVKAFSGHGMILHGSWNDWREKDGVCHGRYRAYLFLERPVTDKSDYLLVWRWMERYCRQHGVTLDPATKDPNRIMYTVRDGTGHPPRKHGHPAQWIACVPGASLNVEALPGMASLSAMRAEADRAQRKAREDARRVLAQANRAVRGDLASAATRRFSNAVDRMITSRAPGAGRNTGVFAAGALLGSYVASGLIADPAPMRARVRQAAEAAGLIKDIERQLENGFEHGLRHPLSLGGAS